MIHIRKRIYNSVILFLLFFTTSFCTAQEQHLVIRFKDGTSNLLKISTIKKMAFDTGMLNINITNGTNAVFANNNIRQMYFEFTTDIVKPSNNIKVFAYPNPTTGIVFFKGLSNEKVNMRIFNMSGMQVFAARINASVESLDISYLPKGIYFVSMNNEQLKLIKL